MSQYKGPVIYMVQADDGPVKIGTASDKQSARRRLVHHQISNHHELKFIRLIRGSYKSEVWLHRYFRLYHIRGEWFQFHPEMLTVKIPLEVKIKDKADIVYRLTEVQYPDERLEDFKDIIDQLCQHMLKYQLNRPDKYTEKYLYNYNNHVPESVLTEFLSTRIAPDKIKTVLRIAEKAGRIRNWWSSWELLEQSMQKRIPPIPSLTHISC